MLDIEVRYSFINEHNSTVDGEDHDLSSVIHRSITFPVVPESVFYEDENWEGISFRVVKNSNNSNPLLSWKVEIAIPQDIMEDALQGTPIEMEMSYFHSQMWSPQSVTKTAIIIGGLEKRASSAGDTIVEIIPDWKNIYNFSNLQFDPKKVIAECGYRHLVNEEGEERKELAVIFIDRKKS